MNKEFTKLADQSGLCAAKIAELLGVSLNTIKNYRAGRSKVPQEKLFRMGEIVDAIDDLKWQYNEIFDM